MNYYNNLYNWIIETMNINESDTISSILENFPSMVGYWDRDFKNKFSNKAYLHFFNMTREEIKDKYIWEVIGEKLYEKNLPYMQKALAGETQAFEREIPLKSGEIAYVQSLYVPDVKDSVVQGFYVLVSDISQLKKLQIEKAEIVQKLVHSSKMVALGEMASGIAHEVNNPLSIINFNINMLNDLVAEKNFDQVKFQKIITTLSQTTERIKKIVAGMLFFAQGKPNEESVNIIIQDILEDTLSFCSEKFKSRDIVFTRQDAGEKVSINCRPTQISQVFLNLLNNAADAVMSSCEKWISVSIKEVGNNVEIAITDSGPGIHAGITDKIMQPFFTTKPTGKGTGLGLSISKSIIEDHEGTLALVEGAKNTTFLITFPRSEK